MQESGILPRDSKHNKRFDWNDLFEIALYVLAAVCFVYFFIHGNTPKYVQPILIAAVLGAIRAVQKFSKVQFFPALRFSILAFIFITMFLAKEFDYYSKIPSLDKIEHLISGVVLFFLGLLHFKHINKDVEGLKVNDKSGIYYGLFFSVAMAGGWEIFEFTTDKIFGMTSQNNSLNDTMMDIICGTIGAVITCVVYRLKIRRNSSAKEPAAVRNH
jgi:uncharacterized membrane protein YjdF